MQKLIDNKKYLLSQKNSRRYEGAQTIDELRLTVADTDFQFPKAMQDDMIEYIKHGDNCYNFNACELINGINIWYKRKYNNSLPAIKTDNIFIGNGAIHLIQIAILAYTQKGDYIICMPPVYPPIINASDDLKRNTLFSNLVLKPEDNRYHINFDEIIAMCKKHPVKMIMLCNPHNPAGRVWTKDELKQLTDIAKAKNIMIISDEIWQDIYFKGHEVTPIIEFDKEGKYKFLSISSGAKTFNLGGSQIGYGITYNKEFMAKMKETLNAYVHYSSESLFSIRALISGYTNPDNYEWYKIYRAYMEESFATIRDGLKGSKLKVVESESLYLAWIDFSATGKSNQEVTKILESNKVYLTPGDDYGYAFKTFRRVTTGISQDDINRLIKILKTNFS